MRLLVSALQESGRWHPPPGKPSKPPDSMTISELRELISLRHATLRLLPRCACCAAATLRLLPCSHAAPAAALPGSHGGRPAGWCAASPHAAAAACCLVCRGVSVPSARDRMVVVATGLLVAEGKLAAAEEGGGRWERLKLSELREVRPSRTRKEGLGADDASRRSASSAACGRTRARATP